MEYPDPDEEFDLIHADDLELMHELDQQQSLDDNSDEPWMGPKSRRSLQFASPAASTISNSVPSESPKLLLLPVTPKVDTTTDDAKSEKKKKRLYSETMVDGEPDDMASKRRHVSSPTHDGYISRQLMERLSRRWAFRKPPGGPSIGMISKNGLRYYILLKDEIQTEQNKQQVGHLLSIPYSVLKEEALTALEEFEIKVATNNSLNGAISSVAITEKTIEDKENVLWVDKYRPSLYIDLLSDEGTNRTLLFWLKLWDSIVFNRKPSLKRKKEETVVKKFVDPKTQMSSVLEELDSNKCPVQKVTLLSGSPGLGKTTLAHVIAHHAGYNVVELNASDDRSVEVFSRQLESATQMKAVFGANPKPNCLIIDEIDGAPAASINFLVNILTTKANTSDGKKVKKKKKVIAIQRPVICICNDLYASALRPLKKIALVLQFPPTISTKLAERLLYISEKQGMPTDMRVLTALSEKSGNDIRSCLSTLHFFHLKRRPLRLTDIQNTDIGLKDSHKGMFSVWHDIFHAPRFKRQHVDLHHTPDNRSKPVLNPTSDAGRFYNVLKSVQSNGDYEKITEGVFENYLNIKFHDTYMEKVCEGIEWFCFADTVSTEIHHNQTWSLLSLMPYSLVACHFLFSVNAKQRITFPASQFEFSQKLAHRQAIITSIIKGVCTSQGNVDGNTTRTLVLDVLPFVIDVIQPSLRSINFQLYSTQEKQDVEKLIDVMMSFNLHYVQQRTPEGLTNIVLDPNLDELVCFPLTELNNQRVVRLGLTAKQQIARELELEEVRRNKPIKLGEINEKPIKENTTVIKPNLPKLPAPPPKKEAPVVPNYLNQKLQPVAPKPKTKKLTFVEYFRKKTDSDDDKPPIEELKIEKPTEIWYHFNTGYSRAVRRDVKIATFL